MEYGPWRLSTRGNPLMVIPEATTLARTISIGDPRLFGLSPDTSMTCRTLVKLLLANAAAANSKPAEMEVHIYRPRPLADRRTANSCADVSLSIRVQGTTMV